MGEYGDSEVFVIIFDCFVEVSVFLIFPWKERRLTGNPSGYFNYRKKYKYCSKSLHLQRGNKIWCNLKHSLFIHRRSRRSGIVHKGKLWVNESLQINGVAGCPHHDSRSFTPRSFQRRIRLLVFYGVYARVFSISVHSGRWKSLSCWNL